MYVCTSIFPEFIMYLILNFRARLFPAFFEWHSSFIKTSICTPSEMTQTLLFLSRTIIKTAGIGTQNKRFLSNTKKLGAIRWVMQNRKPHSQTGYFITLPNVPDESAENNSFLESIEQNSRWPPLQNATPDEFYEGTVKLILEYGASVWEHLDLLDEDAKKAAKGDSDMQKRTFDNTVYSLIEEEYDVYYALNTLLVKMFIDWPECDLALFKEDLYQVQNTFQRELSERWTEPVWVEAVKQAYENERGKLKPWQQRYLEWMILQARLCGVLTVKKNDKKASVQQEINYSWKSSTNLFCLRFLGNIMQDNGVAVPIEHRYLLKSAPPLALALLSKGNDPEIGPWEAMSTKYDSLFAALNYCSAREIRQGLWDSYVTRAAFKAQRPDLNNSLNIEELRNNTEGFAKALGFSSTAQHRISSKMAGSSQTVRVFVDELVQRFRPVFLDRLAGSWKTYAEEHEERIISDLKPFDLFYICRREAELYHNVDTLALMKHFPVSPTFEKMLDLSSELFNIEFVDVSDKEKLCGFERCDPSVRLFNVTDKTTNERIGFLYVDIFSRQHKKINRGTWISLLGRPANQFRALDTLVYFLGAHPQSDSHCLLHHEELSEMLSAFGRALQLLFSRAPCHFLSLPLPPYYASDFDANDFMPAFLKFCIYKPRFLELLSSPNVQTGNTLSTERATAFSKALQRAAFWNSYRVLFWTDFDLTIHDMRDWKKKFWLDLYNELYSEYFPTFKETNYQPCSFTSVFGLSSWSGLFYRKLWSEMLALDVHKTFEKEGNTKVTADRLKAEWLNHGATELQSDLSRRFQGREPNMEGICDFYGSDYEPPSDNESERMRS